MASVKLGFLLLPPERLGGGECTGTRKKKEKKREHKTLFSFKELAPPESDTSFLLIRTRTKLDPYKVALLGSSFHGTTAR